MTLQQFAHDYLDGMYTYGLPDELQCSGWHTLRKMVAEGIDPTEENLSVFHPNLRPFIDKYWSGIKTLRIQTPAQP